MRNTPFEQSDNNENLRREREGLRSEQQLKQGKQRGFRNKFM